ncbi:hypothetical protein [Brevundimonas poindexterae]|uniref:hypothetical protein n=1 Tax=Brevundimonas poindexterae TaxID=74325 RepID=UPI001CFD2404|nr:hypothetical protein [Brevundimonas poindexterae]
MTRLSLVALIFASTVMISPSANAAETQDPTPQEVYDIDRACAAVVTMIGFRARQGGNADESHIADVVFLQAPAIRSGAALGRLPDQVKEDIIDEAMKLDRVSDADLAEIRTMCMELHGRPG